MGFLWVLGVVAVVVFILYRRSGKEVFFYYGTDEVSVDAAFIGFLKE
jgi:hypothetical protein